LNEIINHEHAIEVVGQNKKNKKMMEQMGAMMGLLIKEKCRSHSEVVYENHAPTWQ
jgi:hypothetical protein